MALVIVLIIALLLVISVSLVGPRLAVYVLSQQYAELGDQHTLNVERASLSVWRGQLDIEGVHATHHGTTSQINRVSLAWSWSALFQRTARIAHINIDGIKLAVRVAPGKSTNDAPRVDVFGLTLGENTPSTESSDDAKYEDKNEPADEGGAFAWALTSLALSDIALTLDIQPSPDATPIHTQLHLAKATLADVFPGTENAPAQLELRINELSVGEQLHINAPLDIAWQGQVALGDMDARSWSVGGDVASNKVQLALPDDLNVSLNTFSLNGFILDEKHIAWENVVLDTALLTGLSQQLPQEAPPLSSVGFERFELANANLDVAQQTLVAQDATLNGLSVLANEQPLASLESYTIEQLTLSARAIDTGMHRFANAQLHLEKQANGELWATSAKQTDAQPSQESVNANEDTKKHADASHTHEQPLSIRIKGIEQTSNSTINWRDNSLKPAPDLALNVTELSISEVDSANLAQPMSISMKTKLDEFNQMNANANLALQKNGLEGAFNINIEQLNLVPLSPYVRQAIGYSADQGLLHLTVDSKINQNNLKGTGHLHLASAQFTAQDQNVIERVQRNMTLPLNTALSLLSDQQRSVKIEFPVEGPLDNPNVGMDDLLQTITNKALVAASLFYLKQSFQPYGAMVAVGSYAGDYLLAVRLDPLPLQDEQMAAQDTPPMLNAKQTTYMKKVVETLQKKSELQLTVCPMVSKNWVSGRIKSDSSLTPDFWKKRTADWGLAVKKYLMAQDASLAKRIVVCKPQQGDSSQIEMGF